MQVRAGLFFILFPTILLHLQLALAVPLQVKDLSSRPSLSVAGNDHQAKSVVDPTPRKEFPATEIVKREIVITEEANLYRRNFLKRARQRVARTVKRATRSVKRAVTAPVRAAKRATRSVAKAARWVKKNGPQYLKFGLKTVSTTTHFASHAAKFVPGWGKPLSIALKATSSVTNRASDAIKVKNMDPRLARGMRAMNTMRQPLLTTVMQGAKILGAGRKRSK